MGRITIRVDLFSDIALVIAPIYPLRRATIHYTDVAVVILVRGRGVFGWDDRDQSACFVVLVFGDGAEWIFLGDQAAFVVVGLEVLRTVRINLGDQSSLIVVGVDLFAAVSIGNRDAAFVIPGVMRVHLREASPVMDASRRFTFFFPFPIETGAAGELPLKNDVLVVVGITLGFAGGVFGFDQAVLGVVTVGDQSLDGAPGVFQIVRGDELLVVDGDDVLAVVTYEEGPPDTVIDTFDSPVDVTGNVQTIAVIVTDGNQRRAFGVVAEVVNLTKRG